MLTPEAGGGGESHMKQTGMLVVSLRGVNFGILVSLRVFRAKRQYFMYACIGYDDHVFLTNRFHVAVRLFSNRSQMTSKCGKNKKVAHEA